MEIYIYRTFDEWYKDKVSEVLEGAVTSIYNGGIVIDTVIDEKNYRQIFSMKNNFAFIYKLSYGFMAYGREINVYKTFDSWNKSEPEICFKGEVCEDESGDSHLTFINEDGYKHCISLDGVYAVTYER